MARRVTASTIVAIIALLGVFLAGCSERSTEPRSKEARKPAKKKQVLAVTLEPGDLDLKIVLDEEPRPGILSDPMVRDLTFMLTRKIDVPFRGSLVLGPANERESKENPKKYDFDLTASKEARINTKLSIPESSGIMQLSYPVEVVVGEKAYLEMDLIVLKGLAWRIIGPFEGGPDEAHDTVFPPEEEIDLKSEYSSKGGKKVAWRPFPVSAIDEKGRYDLNIAYKEADEATAYATIDVYSPRRMDAVLKLGSDDSIKVWQNTDLIHDNKIFRPAEPAQDTVDVTLAEGRNTFLLKVCEGGGGWAYYFDLVDKEGEPIKEIKDTIALSRVFLTDPILRLTEVTRDTASVRWKSDVPITAKVIVRKALKGRAVPYPGPLPRNDMVKADPSAEPIIVKTDRLRMNHTATVTGLEPGTRYLVSVDPAVGGEESDPLSFYTAPPEGKTQVLHLKTICIICSNVCEEGSEDKEGSREPAPASAIERIKWEHEQTVRFYYANSGMRYFVDLDFIVDDTFYTMTVEIWHDIAYTENNAEEKLFHDVLARNGKKLTDYDATIMVGFTKHWDPNKGEAGGWVFAHGGGGTVGIQAVSGLGKCGWRVGTNSNSAWLMCHEFGHQIDSLYHESMGPEHIFNHFAPMLDSAFRHGEHWDGMAWIFREWAGYVTREHQGEALLEPTLGFRYLASRWGTVVQYDDTDNDGIPNDAPELPLDEKRLGSDPTKTDTDADGLSDMMEVLACNWVEYGLGYTWAGESNSHFCDPRNPDSDGDGLRDGADPYPIYPVDPEIKKASKGKGEIGWEDLQEFTTVEDRSFEGKFYLGWNDDCLMIGMETLEKPRKMRFCLDLNDNGWYFGHDNYDMEILPNGGARHGDEWHGNEEKTFIYGFHNCGVEDKWPFYEAEGLEDGELTLVQEEMDGSYKALIRVPRNTANGLELVEGEHIGIMLTVDPEGGIQRPMEFNQLAIFEPHSFFTFELAE